MKHLPPDQRPREKLLARGPGALADAELLALLLRTGRQGLNVVAMATLVLQHSGGFAGLLNARPEDLQGIKGLGPAKRAELLAVMEMARRAISQRLAEAPVFNTPDDLHRYLALLVGGRDQEVFFALFLDLHGRLLRAEELAQGTHSQAVVHPREVVKRALALNAASVVFAHNHPSGLAQPSQADIYLTQTLAAALRLVDVKVLDHVVVGGGQMVSLAERGVLG